MNVYDSYSHIHCMKVAVWVKLKRCLQIKFSYFKNPRCCGVHGCQLFLLIPAKRNAFYAKCFQKYQINSVHRKRCKPRTVVITQLWRFYDRKIVITSSSQVMILNKNSNQSQELQTCCLYNERRSTEEIQHKTRNEWRNHSLNKKILWLEICDHTLS